MKIRKLSSQDVKDPKILKRLQFLTNGGWARQSSRMYDIITYYHDEEEAPHVWALYVGAALVGWACLSHEIQPDEDDNGFELVFDSDGNLRRPLWALDVYVSNKHRRQGYGSVLRDKALTYSQQHDLTLSVTPWNYASCKFYQPIRKEVVWDKRCL